MILVVILFILLTVVVLVREFARRRSFSWKMLSLFPGAPPLPLIGNALQLGFKGDEACCRLMEMWRKFGKTDFRVTVGAQDWLFLCTPQNVEVILNHPTELSKPLARNLAIIPFFGHSLTTSEGEQWRSTRKLMAPSFQFKTLEKRVSAVNMHCDGLFNVLDNFVNEGPVDMYRYLRAFMYDLLCDTLMGVKCDLLNNPDHPYLMNTKTVIETITTNYFSYWRTSLLFLTPLYRKMMISIKTIRNTSYEIIMLRRQKVNKIMDETKNNNNKISDVDIKKTPENILTQQDCLLDILLFSKNQNAESIPDHIISDEISLICFTGHYTTAVTMSHVLYHLAKYPKIQKRVLKEQFTIFNGDYLKTATFQDLSQMKYLEAVIKESIRVLPTLTQIGRQLQNDVTLKDGRVAPAGSIVKIYYRAMFSDPKIFSEPEKFNPNRFLNKTMPTFAFVPFSAGPRMCLEIWIYNQDHIFLHFGTETMGPWGSEAKLFFKHLCKRLLYSTSDPRAGAYLGPRISLAIQRGFRYAWTVMKTALSNILRRYEVIPGGPGTEPQFAYRIVTESKNGIHVNLRKRDMN